MNSYRFNFRYLLDLNTCSCMNSFLQFNTNRKLTTSLCINDKNIISISLLYLPHLWTAAYPIIRIFQQSILVCYVATTVILWGAPSPRYIPEVSSNLKYCGLPHKLWFWLWVDSQNLVNKSLPLDICIIVFGQINSFYNAGFKCTCM